MMHDCCGSPDHTPDPAPARLTRRHVLAVGAAVGGAVVLRGVPALGAETEGGTGSASSDSTTTSTTTPSTTTTTPSTTTTAPAVTEPVHPPDPQERVATRSFNTLLPDSPNLGIMFPVFPNSATSWNRNQDTYGASRGGGTRRHQGEDLMADKMVKLLAVKSGTVVELRHRPQSGLTGGNSLYIKGDDGWFYCYLHINNDRPGTDDASNLVANTWGPGLRKFATSSTKMDEVAARGYRVREGEILAYCGDSGNAESSGSHLHFEIRKNVNGKLWDSPSVNPRESLRGAKPAKVAATVPPETFKPWDSSRAFIIAQYRDFLGREPTQADINYYGEMLDYGSKSPDWLMQYFLECSEGDSKTQAVARLYQAFYRRLPDTDGFLYWMDMRRNGGWSIRRMADQFAKTPEFTRLYGEVDNPGYVDLIYRNVLGRDPEPSGKQYWVGELDRGLSRGRVMIGFSESAEYKNKQRNRMHVVGCYGVMLNRVPAADELSAWQKHLDAGNSTRDMVVMLRMGDEYTEAAKA